VTQVNGAAPETANSTAEDEQPRTAASLGDRLKTAREQKSYSIEQVSEALHLDEKIIVALEQGHFESLGAPVYVRGHLKTYARLLGLPPDEVLGEFRDSGQDTFTAPSLHQPGAVTSVTVNPVLLAGGGLVILLALLLGVYVLSGSDELIENAPVSDGLDASSPPMALESERETTFGQGDIEPTPVEIETESMNVNGSPEVPGMTVSDEDVEPPITVDRPTATMRLVLQFNQESWVEISDANRRVLFGLQHKGDRREVSGEPPFSLLIGNAKAVEMTVNGKPFAVPDARVRGKVARFTINGEEKD